MRNYASIIMTTQLNRVYKEILRHDNNDNAVRIPR